MGHNPDDFLYNEFVKTSHWVRLGLAIIILFLSMCVLVMVFWPAPHIKQVIPLPTIEIPLTTPSALLDSLGVAA